MIEFFIIAAIVVESYVMVSIMDLFFHNHSKLIKGLTIIILVIYGHYLSTSERPFLLIVHILTILIYSIITSSKDNVMAKLFLSFCSVLFVTGCSIFMMGLLSIFDFPAKEILNINGNVYVTNVAISKVVLITLYLILRKIVIKYSFTKKQWLLLCSTSIILMVSLVVLFTLFKNQSGDMVVYCGIAIILFVMLYIIFFIYFVIISKKNEEIMQKTLKLQVLEANQEFSKQILDAYESNRKLKHDLNHHLTVIYGKTEDEDIIGIRNYIEQLASKMDKIQIINTTNMTLNNMINYRIAEMEKLDIKFYHQVSNDLSFINDLDIAVLMGNLFGNAIEAQRYVNENRFISLRILTNNGFVSMIMKNSYSEKYTHKDQGKYTTIKEDKAKHGFGLGNINSVVEKYDGVMQIKEENNIFSILITFMNLEK